MISIMGQIMPVWFLTPLAIFLVKLMANQAFGLANGLGQPSGAQAFTINSAALNSALVLSNSNGNYTKYYTFQLSGSELVSYVSYKIYLQSKALNSSTNLKLSYSLDGIIYTDLGNPTALNGSWSEILIDCSTINEINYATNLYFKLSVSTTGTLATYFDNFQIQANFVSPSNSRLKDYPRGMYVNNFIKFNGNPDDLNVDVNLSILGNQARENELLEYAKKSNFTYLLLYDLYPLYKYMSEVDSRTGITFGQELCKFMNKAQNDYCIHRFGVTGDARAFFDNIMSVNQSPVFRLNSNERARISSQSPLLMVEDTSIHKGDQNYFLSEYFKFMLAITSFNTSYAARFSGSATTSGSISGIQCSNTKFDVLTTEWEFWLDRIDNGLSGPSQKYPYFKTLIAGMNDVKRLQEAAGNIIYTEAYMGYLENSSQSNWGTPPYLPSLTPIANQGVANEIDPMLDRILSIYYAGDEWNIYKSSDPFLLNILYNYKFKSLGNSAPYNSVIQPLFNSEMQATGGQSNFFGLWFTGYYNTQNRDPRSFNVFTTEKDFYDQWHADTDPAAKANDIQPGSSHWYSSESLIKNASNPMTFRSNSPVCAPIGGTGHLSFTYQGPINQGVKYDFTVSPDVGNPNTNTVSALNQSWPVYDANQSNSIVFPTVDFPVGKWIAHLKLYYENNPAECVYDYTLNVEVTSDAKIEPSNPNPIVICAGQSIILHASQGTGYLWTGPGVSGNKRDYPIVNAQATNTYTCQVTGGGCGNTISSVQVVVNPNYVPFTTYPPVSATCTGGAPGTILNANAAAASVQWNDGSNGNTYVANETGLYSIQYVQNSSGCKSTYNIHLVKPILDVTPGFANVVCTSTETTSLRITNITQFTRVKLYKQGVIAPIANLTPPYTSSDFAVGVGTYYLTATGEDYQPGMFNGSALGYCMTSEPFDVTTLANVTVSSSTICPNDYTSLICSASGSTISYDWGSGNTRKFLTVHPIISGTTNYTCNVTLSGCGTIAVTGSVITKVGPSLTMSTPNTSSNCTGTASVIAANGSPFTYNVSIRPTTSFHS